MTEIDVELSFPEGHAGLPVPHGYVLEHRGRGYGDVLRRTTSNGAAFSHALRDFLEGLEPIRALVSERTMILRVAYFSSAIAVTLRLDTALQELASRFGADLELSVYPMCEPDESPGKN